jgi:hypothetical protein
LAKRAEQIVDLLDEEGVGSTIIKGMHTAYEYFPEPGARPVSDIDIVVADPSTMKSAGQRLTEAGFRGDVLRPLEMRQDWRHASSAKLPKTLTMVHEDDPWSVDLQGSLDRHFPGRLRLRLNDLVDRSRAPAWKLNSKARTLPQPLLTLHLAAHASQGFLSMSLMRMVELSRVIQADHAAGRLDWESYLTTASQIGASGFAYPALHFTELLVPGTVPGEVLTASAKAAPVTVRNFLNHHTCWSIQRLHRPSGEESFLWTPGVTQKIRAFGRMLIPINCHSVRDVADYYAGRLQVARRLLTR